MEYTKIILERVGNVAVLKLNAPDVLNAMSQDMLREMTHAVENLGDARCLMLTGEGRAFCSGANLQPGGGSAADKNAGANLETHYHPLINRLRNLDIPMVAAVNGPAAGVGMSFAIMSDLVIAAKSAYFLQAFARIGLIPDGGATYFLPRLVGMRRAMELSMLAERLPAEQALEWGLINRVVDDEQLMDEALSVAERLANGPKSLSIIRQAYWQSLGNGFVEQLQVEAELQQQASLTQDYKEGVKAFLEKRDAKFAGS